MIAVKKIIDEQAIWDELAKILDPEIPVLSLVEMKIIRLVTVENNAVTILMSPTFIGCPALDQMKQDIYTRLTEMGCEHIRIDMTFSPPWSTDMLEESTLEKLRAYGVAPPPKNEKILSDTLSKPVSCPLCGSHETRVQSLFGATLCKQMYICESCKQPFERFKPV